MDLSLVERPLPGATNQEHDFGLDRLDVECASFARVFMAPDIQHRLFVMVPPRLVQP